MWRTRFRVNPHSVVAWISRNFLLESGAKSEVKYWRKVYVLIISANKRFVFATKKKKKKWKHTYAQSNMLNQKNDVSRKQLFRQTIAATYQSTSQSIY